jgi:ferredoxin
MMESKSACLVYISPSGTTRKVGRRIAASIESLGYRVRQLDLGKADRREIERFAEEDLGRASLLVVGSPVYADHIVYPVESFLEGLPDANGVPALVYATFGGVSKGITLKQMTEALQRKGYRVKGAAKVLCVHSLFFRARHPLAQGHPDEGDYAVLEKWLNAVADKLEAGDPYELNPRAVKPASPILRLLISTVINMRVTAMILPRYRFCSIRCRRCGACQAQCPTGRLAYLPPMHSRENCLFCMECVRVCPAAAFNAPMWMTHTVLRIMQRLTSRWEEQRTKYYL